MTYSSDPGSEPVLRHAARVIVIDAEARILLFSFTGPITRRNWWLTPGGGLEAGESHREAALREAEEEAGLRDLLLGPCVWTREFVFGESARQVRQRERYYLARVESPVVDVTGQDPVERELLGEHRWWSLAEIEESNANFAPSRLAFFLAPLLAGEIPTYPIDVGG